MEVRVELEVEVGVEVEVGEEVGMEVGVEVGGGGWAVRTSEGAALSHHVLQ